ncbi:MAG: hypothetical protein WC817_04355 [Patescibacteria group bacterium]|jgi:hypothetical protein
MESEQEKPKESRNVVLDMLLRVMFSLFILSCVVNTAVYVLDLSTMAQKWPKPGDHVMLGVFYLALAMQAFTAPAFIWGALSGIWRRPKGG